MSLEELLALLSQGRPSPPISPIERLVGETAALRTVCVETRDRLEAAIDASRATRERLARPRPAEVFADGLRRESTVDDDETRTVDE